MKFFISLILLCLSTFSARGEAFSLEKFIDQTHAPFFPKSVGAIVSVQSQFPVLWWDVIILQAKGEPNWPELQADCQTFAQREPALISKIFCGANLADLLSQASLLEDWTRDYPLRHPRPTDGQLAEQMQSILAQASLPLGPLVNVLRNDPFRSLPELQKMVEGDLRFHLEAHGGMFYDPSSKRILIPVQFTYAANETAKTAKLAAHLDDFCHKDHECYDANLIGAHASTLENESRVKSDLQAVSAVSTVLLLFIVVFVCVTKRWRLLLIAPPIFAAIAMAAISTVAVFGSIHGLTLAFGPGIVGLAMDYGLHIAFSNQPERIWRANLFGLLTTVVVLIVMMLSQIPLLQQLMFFSAVGVSLGSLVIYLIFKKYPSAFSVRSYGVKVPDHPAFALVILALVIISIVGLVTTSLNLDMRQIGYQAPHNSELSEWLYKVEGSQSPLLQIYPANGESLQLAHAQKSWADANGIRSSGVATFLPDLSVQKANLATWSELKCETPRPLTETAWYRSLAQVDQQFFKPYFEKQMCGTDRLQDLTKPPRYVRDFGGAGGWLTLWHPETPEQTSQIKAQFPGVLSYYDLAMMFPKIFAQELAWMVPVSMLLAFLILVYYYRKFSLACLAVLPFFSGLGLCVLMNMIFQWHMSFISVIGLIMVFGFSLDFGVFATDLMGRQKLRPDQGIWTALTVAAFINGCGFMPLMFCHHPVLTHLGRTLLFGTVGTYLGSIWGIPGIYRFLNRENNA